MSVPVRVRNLEKNFGRYPALKGVSLDVEAGELVALLGPSGSGKTTLLRAIAGLEQADGGQVLFGDIDANSLSLRERRIGFVFQQYALFKHMTVFDNIAFGLRARPRSSRPSEAAIKSRVLDLLHLVQLDGLEVRYPAQLSGGQRQRVALARALAIEPRVLLLDEPFGALDAFTREELWCTLRDIQQQRKVTVMLVTHDLREAVFLADTVYVMSNRPGRIVMRREIGLARPRDLEVTYTPEFQAIVHELRMGIGGGRH